MRKKERFVLGKRTFRSQKSKHFVLRIILRVIIGQIYADYIEQLHTRYPKLNEDDVLLLCLQLADLSPFAIALCFGNNDAQIVAQRKYRMKSKME